LCFSLNIITVITSKEDVIGETCSKGHEKCMQYLIGKHEGKRGFEDLRSLILK
jgi:hypothetical protein